MALYYRDYEENGTTPKEIRARSPVVLYRESTMEKDEIFQMNKHIVSVKSRMDVHGGDLVIGRYSVLPMYKDLEIDLNSVGAVLINTYRQHLYVAGLQDYVSDLGDMTPKTWNSIQDVPDNVGACVLKGATNSRKHNWNTHMFANNKKEAIEVFVRLQEDALLADQGIFIREYVPLAKVDNIIGINGMPVTREFRFFVCYGQVLCGGYYWSSFVDEMKEVPKVSEVPMEFLQKAIDRVKDSVNFFAIDIGIMENGQPVVVELNDGQMAGLSENDPETLYRQLKKVTWDDLPK